MKLKKIVKSLDGIDESLHGFYIKRGDNFILDIEGDDDTSALRNAKDREKERADEEATLRRDAEKKLRETTRELDDLRNSPETSELKTKLEKSEERFGKMQEGLKTTAKKAEAERIASEISKSPKLLSRFIADRLNVEVGDDGIPVVKAMKTDGSTADDFTFDLLKKEFASSEDFKDIIISSKAHGGGAGNPSDKTAGGAHFTQNDSKPADLSQMPASDLAARIKAKKEAAGAT